jgi:hypothetical protein
VLVAKLRVSIAICCLTRILRATKLGEHRHSVGSSDHPAAAFHRAVPESAPLADAVHRALMLVAGLIEIIAI